MTDLLGKSITVIGGVIGLIVAAQAIATTNSGTVGALAWTVLSFVVPLLAITMLYIYKN